MNCQRGILSGGLFRLPNSQNADNTQTRIPQYEQRTFRDKIASAVPKMWFFFPRGNRFLDEMVAYPKLNAFKHTRKGRRQKNNLKTVTQVHETDSEMPS